MSTWPETTWDEPDPELLDQVTRAGCFAADHEALQPGLPSRVPNPDGSLQPETGAERTRRVLRAALRMLAANQIIRLAPVEEWPEYTALLPPPETPESS